MRVCLGAGSLSRESLSRGLWGPLSRGGVSVQELGSVCRWLSVWRQDLKGVGSVSRGGVYIQGVSIQEGSLSRGGSPSRGSLSWISPSPGGYVRVVSILLE